MDNGLMILAEEMMGILGALPGVEKCALYGSLKSGNHDELSDIDIEIYVSGVDNGVFALELPDMLRGHMRICYADYAPSLAPEKYVVSLAVDEDDPFRMVDICVCGEPHCGNVTKRQLAERNAPFTHTLKLWTANMKHHVRGAECHADIAKMAGRLGIDIALADATMLEGTLEWLESNAAPEMRAYVASCRRYFEKLINR